MQRDGERLYRCKHCQDDGLVIVWSKPAMTAMRRAMDTGKPFTGPKTSVGVRCVCSVGNERWKSQKVEFSEIWHCPCDYHPSPEDVQNLEQHIVNEGVGTTWTGGSEF